LLCVPIASLQGFSVETKKIPQRSSSGAYGAIRYAAEPLGGMEHTRSGNSSRNAATWPDTVPRDSKSRKPLAQEKTRGGGQFRCEVYEDGARRNPACSE